MTDELHTLSADQLLQTLLARTALRHIGARNADRRDWLKAEEEVTRDLHLLATSSSEASSPAVPEGAAKTDKGEVLEALLDALEVRVERLPVDEARALAQQTRVIPLAATGLPDWNGVRELGAAWAQSLQHGDDGDGDEKSVPSQAEELIEQWDAHRRARKPKKAPPPFSALVAERGAAPLEPFGISKTFRVGDWIDHKKFGEGLVLEAHDKIRVRFEDQERVLVHTPPPVQKIGAAPVKKVGGPVLAPVARDEELEVIEDDDEDDVDDDLELDDDDESIGEDDEG